MDNKFKMISMPRCRYLTKIFDL